MWDICQCIWTWNKFMEIIKHSVPQTGFCWITVNYTGYTSSNSQQSGLLSWAVHRKFQTDRETGDMSMYQTTSRLLLKFLQNDTANGTQQNTTKCWQLKQTVYQFNRAKHRGGCRRLGDQNKHTCQEGTEITELFEAWLLSTKWKWYPHKSRHSRWKLSQELKWKYATFFAKYTCLE